MIRKLRCDPFIEAADSHRGERNPVRWYEAVVNVISRPVELAITPVDGWLGFFAERFLAHFVICTYETSLPELFDLRCERPRTIRLVSHRVVVQVTC